jgi:hypothetical protein
MTIDLQSLTVAVEFTVVVLGVSEVIRRLSARAHKRRAQEREELLAAIGRLLNQSAGKKRSRR